MGIIRCTFCGLLAVVALSPAPEETTIRANVSLVQLQVTVTDARGRTVSGLPKEAFQLFVDNNPQPITVFQGEDAPVTAGIVIDNSSSMTSKVKEVVAAGLAFAGASNPKDQMFVVHFTDRPRLGLPEGKRFTGDVAQLEKAVEAFQLGGTTAFYDALLFAESHLQWALYSRKILLTITDGGDNSSHATLEAALSTAVKSGIVVYPIGLFDENDRDRNPKVLSKIAEETGGQAFFPEQVSDVTNTCVMIAREIRSQYTLGFPGAEDGKFHHIRVTVTDTRSGPLQVHTRGGYFAVKPPPNANRQK